MPPDRRILLVLLLLMPWIVSMAAFRIFNQSSAHMSVFELSNLVGPTAETLLHGA